MSIRSRDIVLLERELTGQIHPALLKMLIRIAEDHNAMKQNIMTLASLMDRMADNQSHTVMATRQLQEALPLHKRAKELAIRVGSDPTLTGEGDE